MQCLNLNNKEVKAALDELTTVLGSEDAAYYVISENNGYAIDQAPNGAQSKLFSDLLEYYNGDRAKAIYAKARTFTDSFKNWFGDWLAEDKTEVSKVVDGNGEPLVVYHGGAKNIKEFDTTGSKNTGAGIQKGIKGTYFTTSMSDAKRYEEIALYKMSDLADGILDAQAEGEISKEEADEILGSLGTAVYPVFLNVKNQIVDQYRYDKKKVYNKDGTYRENKDGVIRENHNQPENYDGQNIIIKHPSLTHFSYPKNQYVTEEGYDEIEWVVLNPNQIKSVDNEGEFSTSDNNIYRKVSDDSIEKENASNIDSFGFTNVNENTEMNSIDIIQIILQNSDDDYIKDILSIFKDLNINIPTRLSYSTSYMQYTTDNNAGYITINPNTFSKHGIGYNISSYMHELIHAYTIRSINRAINGQGTQLENQIYEYANKLLNLNRDIYSAYANQNGQFVQDLYGLNDIYEFVSEFLTNRAFFDRLMDDANQMNQFDKFIQAVKFFWNSIVEFITGKDDINITNKEQLREKLLQLLSYNVDNSIVSDNDYFKQNSDTNIKQLEHKIEFFKTYQFDTKEELNKRLSRIRTNILNGLQSRLRSIDEKDLSKRTEIIENIKYQIANLQNEAIEDITVISNFVDDLRLDVKDIGNKIINAYKGITPSLSDDELVSLNKNYFSFYCNQTSDIYNSLVNMDSYKNIIGEKEYNTLMYQLQLCKSILDSCYDAVKRMQVENAKDAIIKEGLKVSSPTILNYISENSDQTDVDITYITRMLASGDKINDEAIKSLFSILQETENSINEVVFYKATELNKLLKVAGNRNQKLLFEVDDEGNTTGYIIRDLNYGKFYKELKEFKEQLNKEFGISYNQLSLPENIETRIAYNRKLNQWLSDHCERKYTNKFYDLLNSLSPEAASAREMILQKIRVLSNKYRDSDGIIHYESMSDEEWSTLQNYELEKKQIASIYDIYGNEKPEGSVERRIADELTKLNEELSKGLQHTYNQKKFQDLIESKRNSLSKKEFNKWMERNTRVVYTEEFYEELAKIERTEYGQEYAEYSKQKRTILNMFRDSRTGEINADLMPNSTKRLLDQLDIKMRNIRKSNNRKNTKSSMQFKNIAKIIPTEAYKKAEQKAALEDQTVPGSLELFYIQNTYQTVTGQSPRSWYVKIVPKDNKYIQILPSTNLSELSSESPFSNPNYDTTNDEYYQPKRSLYDNSKAFNKVMSNSKLKQLRQAIIDTMEESNQKLNNLENLNKYRLPQISGSWYKYLKASGYNPFKATKDYTLDAITRKNDDVGLQDKVRTAPDGTSLSLIPQYFTKMLDNPATISADMVGSVVQYYKMAENFKQKNEIKGKVENIKAFLAQRRYTGTSKLNSIKKFFGYKAEPKQGSDTNLYKFAEKFINMNLYDVKVNALSFNVANREISLTKLLNSIRIYGTTRNLGLNFACAFTGFFTAMHAHLVNLMVGRYYNWNDALHAFKDLVFDLFKHGLSVGSRTYTSEQMAYMDYFQVGGTLDKLYKNTNRPRAINILTDNWAFGIYSASDYIVKGLILNSVMYNYRYIDGQFMHQEQFFDKYGRNDATKKRWNKAKSFKALTKFSAGRIVATDKIYQDAVDKSKFNIGNTARKLSGSADGQLSELQKTQLSANVFGALCMMHRQYIPIILQESFTMDRQWDYQTQRYTEAVLKTPLRVFNKLLKDKQGVELLTVLSKQLFLNKGFDSELDRTNIKKLKLEIALCMILYPLIRNALKEDADRDKRNLLLNMFAFVMAKTAFETTAPYNVVDIYRTIKTPTPLYSLLDNVGGVISYPFTLLYEQTIRPDKPSKINKRISRGAYRGKTQIEKALWQLTPFKNIIELNDIPSKRRYYDTQITGN